MSVFGPTQEELKLALLASWTPPLLITSLSLFNYSCVIPDIVCKAEELNFLTCGFTPPSKLFWTLCPPLQTRQPKAKWEPWLKDAAPAARRECRRSEHRVGKGWTAGVMLRACWRHDGTTVRDAERKYLSDINLSNCHKPCVLLRLLTQ